MERKYSIRRISSFRDSSGEYNPPAYLVDLTVIDGSSIKVVTIGCHNTELCAQHHIDFHAARMMPCEGGDYNPYDCNDHHCKAFVA